MINLLRNVELLYPQRHKNFEIFTKYELKGIKG